MHQQETSGAIGVLGEARGEAGLPEQRRLLVARHAAHWNGRAEQLRLRFAEDAAGRAHLGQHFSRHAEQPQQLGVPAAGVDVVEHRARGVAGIGGMDAPAGEVPQQPGVDGAEGEFAAGGARPCALHVIEQPAQLRAGEIRVGEQAGAAADLVLGAAGLQLVAQRGGAAVLPDDGVGQRLAGAAVPQHGGLALVGDADGGDVARRQPGALERFGGDAALRGPYLQRIVLDPARLRIDLAELLLGEADDASFLIEDDGAARCGSLIECEQIRHRIWRFPFPA